MMNDKPLLKLFIPFVCGLLCAIYFDWFQRIPVFAIFILLAAILPFTFFHYKKPFLRNNIIYNLLLSVMIFVLGTACVKMDISQQKDNSLESYANRKIWAEVSVDEMPSEGKNSMKLVVELLRYKDSTEWHSARGKFMLFLEKDSLSKNLNYQDKILLYTTLSEVQSSKNPNQFDYKRYLSNKKIHYQSYSSSGQWAKTGSTNKKDIFTLAYVLRKKMIDIVESSGLDLREQALASALLLGWDDKIDASTLQAFSTAGLSHLLCVSGLHVGIIFAMIGYGLFFLERTRKLRLLKGVLQLLLVWFFAMMTGLAPSVVRSATMLSFVVFARLLNRKSNTYNNVAGAAWVLLLYDPFYLLDVGFQLSFTAVLGIVGIQPLLSKLIQTKYKSINYVWDLACVSIAAQLATLPFVLYYFHQFPVHFLIANVLIIPFSGFILGTALFLILFSSVPFLSWILVKLFSFEISFIYYIVEFVEKLPYALISNIHFDMIQAVLVTIIILGFSIGIVNAGRRIVYFSSVMLILFLCYSSVDLYAHSKQQQWIVYNINNKYSGIEFITGKESFLYTTEFVLVDTASKKFSTEGFRNSKRLSQMNEFDIKDSTRVAPVFKKGNFFKFSDDRILVCNSDHIKHKSDKKVQLDYLVLTGNPKVRVGELQTQFEFHTLIIDASNSNYRINQWRNECDSLGLSYHDVKSSGAFVKEIK